MDRRDFLTIGGLGLAGLVLPIHGRAVAAEELLSTLDVSLKKAIADAALEAATKAGASYCDVRVGRYLRQFVLTRENRVENTVNTESSGIGVRVIVNGTWGFAATSDLTKDGAATAAAQAAAIARANSRAQTEPVQLAKVKGVGEVTWSTPIRKNAMAVPLKDKAELLLAVNAAALKAGANFVSSNMFAINEQKYFASTDGSYIDQDIHRIWVPFTVTAVDQASGRFRTRDGLSAPMGMGYEYLDGDAPARFVMPNGVVTYGNSYDMVEDAIAAAQQAREKLKAPSVKPGKYDLVLDPSHLWLTIHESVGHPLELDRVLGYEANFAGTSFATLDKLKSRFRYGSDKVTLFADRIQPHSLGAAEYDDEGVKTQRWDLVKDGILVNYQAIRDQAHIIGAEGSHGCCYADSWSSVQFQRMANVSLAPGAGEARRRRHDQGRRERHLHHRRRLVLDRPAALQRAVRRAAVLRDQGRPHHRHDRGRGLPDPHPRVLELLRRRLRSGRLPVRRLVLRRQGTAEPVLGRLARLEHRALQRRERHQHRAQAGLSGPAAGDTP